jgi:long-chain-fatty-acid--CoA ligase ACSBG
LNYVKPTGFFAVPRVYEKFEERIRETLGSAGFIKKKISKIFYYFNFLVKFAQKTGTKYIDGLYKDPQVKPFLYPLANAIVYKKIKKALGLENSTLFAFGAAPLKKQTLEFFKSIGIPLHNIYGMSESTGPQFSNLDGNPIELNSVGVCIPGTGAKIQNPDHDGVGEICFRGRNRFMGYYKNEVATLETIDSDGFLHSGDQGYINKNGNLLITGRIKELIVTAGGENVAPLPIEEALKETCKVLSTIVVLGDDKKYLAALLTLKTDANGNLTKEVLDLIKEMGSEVTNTIEAINCDKIKFYVQKCIDEVNKKAVSRAQLVRKWTILPNEFSIDGGELTPTLKIKRKFVSQKYSKIIDTMYSDPKF